MALLADTNNEVNNLPYMMKKLEYIETNQL
jgi:hypothetical protein